MTTNANSNSAWATVSFAPVPVTSDDDTVNLELSAEDLLRLSDAAQESIPDIAPVTVLRGLSPGASLLSEMNSQADDAPRAQGQENGFARRFQRVPFVQIGGVLSLVTLAVLWGSAVYVSKSRARTTHADVEVATLSPVPVVVAAAPTAATNTEVVRFSNPFDAQEVFEFPPGTSEAEARERVAAMLTQRAREREISSIGRNVKVSL
ncbi:MAG: hypothetical protein ABI885_16060 [Gammaproteobacteria bacterium]